MKLTYTILFFAFSLCIIFNCSSIHANVITPNDSPTAEALIQLHKDLAKQEKEARDNYTLMTAGQELVTNVTDKFKKTRSVLDSKLNDLNQYVDLAASIGVTGISLYKLIDEYADFTSNTYAYAKKKPMVLWYYNNANKAIADEVKHCQKLYAVMALGFGYTDTKSTTDRIYVAHRKSRHANFKINLFSVSFGCVFYLWRCTI